MVDIVNSEKVKPQAGFSLIEVLMAVVILGIITLALTSLFESQQHQMQALDQKFEVQNLRNAVMGMLQNRTTCVANLTNSVASFDISDATLTTPSVNSINVDELHVGPTLTSQLIAKRGLSLPGKPAGTMVVASIVLGEIYATGGTNEYKGTWKIDIAPDTMIRALKPVKIDQIITINGSTPYYVTNCGSYAAPAVVEIALNATQSYAPNECPGGWMLSPNLTMRRQDCNTSDTWVGVAMPEIDGVPRFEYATEFGSPKGGGAGHSWWYYIKGLSRRYYAAPASLDPTLAHSVKMTFYIGNRGNLATAPSSALGFLSLTSATPATAHPCIKLFETTLTSECLH